MATKAETETVIVWTAEDEKAEVYSLMPRIWRACERAGGEEIETRRGIRDGRVEAKTYLVPASAVKIRKPRQMTEKQRLAAEARGRVLAARTSGLRAKE